MVGDGTGLTCWTLGSQILSSSNHVENFGYALFFMLQFRIITFHDLQTGKEQLIYLICPHNSSVCSYSYIESALYIWVQLILDYRSIFKQPGNSTPFSNPDNLSSFFIYICFLIAVLPVIKTFTAISSFLRITSIIVSLFSVEIKHILANKLCS